MEERQVNTFTESIVEDAALTWLKGLGWAVRNGLEIAPGESGAERQDFSEVVLAQRLRDALVQLNPELPAEALEDALRKLTRPEDADLPARNRAVHRLLVDGVTVEYKAADGGIRGAPARVLDFDFPENNDWLAVNQFSVTEGQHTRRPDVVLFVNGLPLAVIELKNPGDENATVWTAYHQLQTYQAQIPALFAPRRPGGLRRHLRPDRRAGGGQGVVQAVADHHRPRRRSAGHARAAGGPGGRV